MVSYAGSWEVNGLYNDPSGTICKLQSVKELSKIMEWSNQVAVFPPAVSSSYMYRLKTGKWAIMTFANTKSTLYISVDASDTPPTSSGGCGTVWESVHGEEPCPSVTFIWKGAPAGKVTRPTTHTSTAPATTEAAATSTTATTTRTILTSTSTSTLTIVTLPTPESTEASTRTTAAAAAGGGGGRRSTTAERYATQRATFPTRPATRRVPIVTLADGSKLIVLHFVLVDLKHGRDVQVPGSAAQIASLVRLRSALERKGMDTSAVFFRILPNLRLPSEGAAGGAGSTGGGGGGGGAQDGLNSNNSANNTNQQPSVEVPGSDEDVVNVLVQITISANASLLTAKNASDSALARYFEGGVAVSFYDPLQKEKSVVGFAVPPPSAMHTGVGRNDGDNGNNGASSEDPAQTQQSSSNIIRTVLIVIVCLFLVSGSVMVMMTKRRRIEAVRAQEAGYGQQAQRYENPQYDKQASAGGSDLGKIQVATGRGGGEDGATVPLLVNPPQMLLDERVGASVPNVNVIQRFRSRGSAFFA
eukprot:gene2773-10308_t